MRISFASNKLQKTCESEKELRRAYGKDGAEKVMARLSDLRAAATLEDMRRLPGRCHELKNERKGKLAIDLVDGWRLVIEPAEGWPETKREGSEAWTGIDSARVLEIIDYH